jgi:hypothetical protein
MPGRVGAPPDHTLNPMDRMQVARCCGSFSKHPRHPLKQRGRCASLYPPRSRRYPDKLQHVIKKGLFTLEGRGIAAPASRELFFRPVFAALRVGVG